MRARVSSKTEKAKAVFCSVMRRVLTTGHHWGCFCFCSLECLSAQMVERRKGVGGTRDRGHRGGDRGVNASGCHVIKKICTHLWGFFANTVCSAIDCHQLCILRSTVCAPV